MSSAKPDRPKLLDLFCGAGGAAAGYARAGFDVIGVDHVHQPRYPFKFVKADALEVLSDLRTRLRDVFTLVHASPPCQAYSSATCSQGSGARERYPDLVGPVRDALVAARIPYVIENVPGAPLKWWVELCGTMFPGLKVYRHRWFECWPFIGEPAGHPEHVHEVGPMGHRVRDHGWMTVCGHCSSVVKAREAMGIDWPMRRDEVEEAIPPPYTRWIGRRMLEVVNVVVP